MEAVPWRCCQEGVGYWRYYQPQSLPAACQCRDWANWESPAAGSAPGDGVPREPTGVTPRGKGRIQVQAAWQPFIPSCWGGGWWGTEWDGEGRMNGTAEKYISTI